MFGYDREDAPKMKCKDCGHIGYVKVIRSYENDDADGNRGEWLTWIECRKCGSEDLTTDLTEE